ncbi:MAG: aldehyde dehydrogenase family protein [Mycobacterium sp.]|uniref:aldehyde dehydrogenase family protein n=1 Tax=Mycobacterium sp. TaxID=1785 RepID=UPI001EB27610|nr:aldehyde dehydrogenase family protein [Mycobacterium sp.]MBW0018090.1 aldehyde dehydrogenase family protein [Mycobacterium sp.]
MRSYDRLFIGGGWVAPAGAGAIQVMSHHIEQVVARAPEATAADVNRAVAAAREAFDHGEWPQLTPGGRADYLAALAAAYQPRVPEMATVITAEMGSPIGFSQAGQAFAAVMLINAYVEHAGRHPCTWRQALRATSPASRCPSTADT